MTWLKWKLDLVHLEILLILMQDRCMVCAERTIGSEMFWTHPMVLHVMRLKWKLDSVCLEILLILGQDRCTVCAERTIGLEIVLDTLDRTPRRPGPFGVSFWSGWR